MKGGDLRHVLVIEQPAETRAASGSTVNAPWTTFATIRGQIEPLGGSEPFRGEMFVAEASHRVTTRYYPGVTTKMRINFNGRYFDILNINNVEERNREFVLQCKEGRSHGNV